jgi:fluoride exporter
MDEHRSNEAAAAGGPASGHPRGPDEVSRSRRATPPLSWGAVALVAAGGAIGAVARVGLTVVFPVDAGGVPWTTWVENVGGALLLGLVLTLLLERVPASDGLRLLVCTGALGAFTTYSTFATELADRLLGGHAIVAAVYAVTSLVAGLTAAVVGMRLARLLPVASRGRSAR